jgi:hypothetical protein
VRARLGSALFLFGALAAGATTLTVAEEVPVPGGPAAIRRLLALDPTRPRETFFLDLHEALLAGAQWYAGWPQIERRRKVVEFTEDIATFRSKFGRTVTLSFSEPPLRDRTRQVLDWLGVDTKRDGDTLVAKIGSDEKGVRRRAFFDAVALPVPILVTKLLAGERVTVVPTDETVVLPFGLATWRELLGEPRLALGQVFVELVKNIPGSRLLVTLHLLDADTREGLRAIARSGKASVLRDPEILERLARFPGALALSRGEFHLPGGREADPIWTDLFGVAPSNTAALLRALFEKDQGRGAYVVEVLQQLPAPVTRALLFGAAGPGAQAIGRARKLYRAIEEARRSVDVFRRDLYDFGHLARFFRALPSGEIALLPMELDGEEFPKNEEELASIVAKTGKRSEASEDALARLLRGAVGAGGDAPRAARRFLVVSSLLEGRPLLADRGVVALLLRGTDRFSAAYALLEDAPLQEPALARRYLFTVDRLDRRKPSRDAEIAAALFQEGAELLATTYRAGSIDGAATRDVFSAYLDLRLFSRADVPAAAGAREVLAWVSTKFLPALRNGPAAALPARGDEAEDAGQEQEEDSDSDELLSRALVGSPPPAVFLWNGGHYRFDPAGDELQRRRAFREKQRLATIGDLEAADKERASLLAAAEAGKEEEASASAAALLDRLGLAEEETASREDERLREEYERAREALERFGKISKPASAAQLEKDLAAVDAVFAERVLEALLGHVYAAAAGDPEDLYYDDPDFVRRHSFRTVEKGGRIVESAFAPTMLTSESTGGGSRIAGSLFGLSDVLGLLHADQITYTPGAAISNEVIRSGLVGPIRRVSAARLDDDALVFVDASCRATEELAASIGARDRSERVRAWNDFARDLVPRQRLVSLAELDGADVTPASVSRFLSPSELYRIGRRIVRGEGPEGSAQLPAVDAAKQALQRLEDRYGASGAGERVAEFGPRAVAWAGRMRLTDLDMPPYESLASYRTPLLFADRLYDWKIAVARAVAGAGLPAGILPLVLPKAVDEMMSDLKMAFPYDWSAIVRRSAQFGTVELSRVLDESLQAGRLMRDHTRDADASGGH